MGNNIIWDAEDYTKSNGAQYRDAKETIDLIIKDVPLTEDMIVVDIGCGSGNVTKMLCGSLTPKKIFASDFDAQMVEYAKEKCGNERIEYFVQDISVPWDQLDERLKKLEGKVDLVWSNRVLHWVPDKETAVKTISRLLKPGGHCYVNITLLWDLNKFEDEFEKKQHNKYFNFPTRKEQSENWDSCFKNCGLSQVNIHFLEKVWTMDSEEDFQIQTSAEPYLNMVSKRDFQELPETDKKTWYAVLTDKLCKLLQTPFEKNPKTDIDENPLQMYYQQFRVIGKK